jgi:excisionase family DNA binding protein
MLSKKFYTVEEAAEYWGVSSVAVLNWVRQGRLGATRLGNRLYRITEADITSFEKVLPVREEVAAE